MIKILLDTDIGGDIDDAICLAYLLKEPNCELLGITTVSGESEKRAMVADAICRAANRYIPIVAGADMPLQPIPLYPTAEGAAALSHWKHKTYIKANAADFMYQIIKKYPYEVVLFGIGNMTNIASLFNQYPDAVSLLRGLYVMNGYFGYKKLPEAYYNWNSWADPLASKVVFASKVANHKAISLEVTEKLTLTADKTKVIFNTDLPLIRAVLEFGNVWLEDTNKLTFHDPLVAISFFYDDICSFERGYVDVETNNVERMGATVFKPDLHGNVEISRTVNIEKFFNALIHTINA